MVSIMYKTLIIPILLLWSSASFAINSVSIVTTGTGQSEDAALMQAFKNAVSKVYGTYIYSYTESSNNELISDEIIGIEKGFVKSAILQQLVIEYLENGLRDDPSTTRSKTTPRQSNEGIVK